MKLEETHVRTWLRQICFWLESMKRDSTLKLTSMFVACNQIFWIFLYEVRRVDDMYFEFSYIYIYMYIYICIYVYIQGIVVFGLRNVRSPMYILLGSIWR